MRLKDLNNKKILIWGLGQEGRGFVEHVTRKVTSDFFVCNDSPFSQSDIKFLNEHPQVTAIAGADLKEVLTDVSVIVKSPGVSLYKEEIQTAIKAGVTVTSGSNIWFAENPSAKTIIVSASKGKSTTSALLAHMLEKLGNTVKLAGNIGVPLVNCLSESPVDYWVIELSSYQLADFSGTANHGILLNLYSDHLDWHGTQAQYEQDKLRLLECVAENGHALLNSSLQERFDVTCAATVSCYDASNTPLQVCDTGLAFEGHTYPLSSDLFPGTHTRKNIVAAISLLDRIGYSVPECIESLEGFTPLPHRLTAVANKDGVLFIDDSISTIPQSCVAAVAALAPRSCILIVGGYDRGVSWKECVPDLLVPHVRAIVCTGQNGTKIRELLPRDDRYVFANSFDDAVRYARQIATSGEAVLLSPGAPSFDEFADYKARGKRFLELVDVT
jgi:UDP-N-acetylmuramoylalanine--D-glutamate ligase